MYENIITGIDAELSRLHQVRTILTGMGQVAVPTVIKKKRGRPAKNAVATKAVKVAAPKKRVLSPEARAKIAAAQKARWAAAKTS